MGYYVLNDCAQLSVNFLRIVPVNSGNKIGALTKVRLVFLAPLDPLVVTIADFHKSRSTLKRLDALR